MAAAEAKIAAEREQLDQSLSTVQGETESLKKSASYFQELARVQMLGDAAMVGNGAAFDALLAYKAASPELNLAANAQRQSLMTNFTMVTIANGVKLDEVNADGSTTAEDELSVERLFEILAHNPEPPRRARAAQLLGNKRLREMRVVDACVKAMESDASLCVRHEALQCYESFFGGKRKFGTLGFFRAKEKLAEDRAYLESEFAKPQE